MAAEISLIEELRAGGYEASLIATYNAYLPFYEEVVLRRLMAAGCRHNVLLMDHAQCVRALQDSGYKPHGAGSQYTLVPMKVPGSFHPKVAFLAGPKKALALIGSHNLTISGFGYNREITNRIEAAKGGEGDAVRTLEAVWSAVAAWIRSQEGMLPKEVVQAALSVINPAQWIKEGEDGETPFVASAPGRPSLWDQVRAHISFKVKRVAVLGPFFDEDFAFLSRLSRDLGPKEITVGVEPETVALGNPRRFPEIARLVDARRIGKAKGYLHAKALLCESTTGTAVLATGSANPGFSAWLAAGMEGNAEALVVSEGAEARRMAAALELDALFDCAELSNAERTTLFAKRTERKKVDAEAAPISIAIPNDDGFEVKLGAYLDGVYEARLIGAGGVDLGKAARIVRRKEKLLISVPDHVAKPAIRELSLLRKAGPAVLVIVHHAEEIADRARSGRQAQFRAALASLSGATPDLAKLITLVGDIIFDADAEVSETSSRTARDRRARGPEERPESLGVSLRDVQRKRAAYQLIRSGDFGYLLDVLIHRLGVGLDPIRKDVDHLGRSEEEQRNQDDESPASVDALTDQEVAATCRRKVRTLVSRMGRQLERAASGKSDGRLALAQLLAVLATIRELRAHEQQARWRSIGEALIYEEDRGELLASALAYLYGRRYALMKKTLAAAATDEQPDEIQRLPGLLLWLAWDCDLQVDNRSMFGEEPDAARGRAAQKAMLLAIAPVAAANPIAREEAEKSILRTARPSQTSSSRTWLATQLAWGEHLSQPDQRHTTDRLRIGDVAYIAAQGPRELYVVSTTASDYIGLVDLSEADAEVRFLPDRITRFSF